MRTTILLLLSAILLAAVSCSIFQRVNEHVENFLDRIEDAVNRLEAAGLISASLAERTRELIADARDNWSSARDKLLAVLAEIRDLLDVLTADPYDWDAAVEQAHLDGILTRAETDRLRTR